MKSFVFIALFQVFLLGAQFVLERENSLFATVVRCSPLAPLFGRWVIKTNTSTVSDFLLMV